MVDVSAKPSTLRQATAAATVFTNTATLDLATSGRSEKGDVFTTARLAGIMAAKRTAELIPLCHPLSLTAIEVTLQPHPGSASISIESAVSTTGPTGVEMEALTAVSVAALTVYDMLKAADRSIRISDIHLVSKSGGASGDYAALDAGNTPVALSAAPADGETVGADDMAVSGESAVASEPDGDEQASAQESLQPLVDQESADAHPSEEEWQEAGSEEALAAAAGEAGWAIEAEDDSEAKDERETAGDDVAQPTWRPPRPWSEDDEPAGEEVPPPDPSFAPAEPDMAPITSEESAEDELVTRPWSGVIPSVTTAEPSLPESDPGLRETVTLQTGEVIADVVEVLKRVYEAHPALAAYDMTGVSADNALRSPEIEAAAPLIPGFSPALIEALAQRDAQISSALENIPANASLAGSVEAIPWFAVGALIKASVGPGIGLSRATRILHKKRPALIPVIDEGILRYALRLEPKLPAEPADQTLRVMAILKQDLDNNLQALTEAAEDVEDVALTPLRVLDLTIRSLQ